MTAESGGAWYPSVAEVFGVVNAYEYPSPEARAAAIIRRIVDLIRERQWCLTMARAELDSGSDVEAGLGHGIARQPIQPAPDRLTIVLQPSGVHLPIQRREDGTWESADRGDGTPYFGQPAPEAPKVSELETEVRAWLDSDPAMIRVREGGGLENLAASLAVNLARIQRAAPEAANG